MLEKSEPGASVSPWAFRYAASLPNVICVLSGMTRPEHLEDNIKTFTPLTDAERETLAGALRIYSKTHAVPCTTCRYCTPCPVGQAR